MGSRIRVLQTIRDKSSEGGGTAPEGLRESKVLQQKKRCGFLNIGDG